ncbi:MAG: ORF6N domain-containing protein [Betaproteobacteria bacterium]
MPRARSDSTRIDTCIVVLRGHRVILSSDLAALYGVPHKRLNEQVRRNRERFPPDFLFSPTNQELGILKSQSATSSWGGRRKPPLAFTEHGAVMAANVVNTRKAIEMSIFVVRAFVQLRESLESHKDLSRRIDDLERKMSSGLAEHDAAIREVLEAVRRLMLPVDPAPRRRIGFIQS